VNVTAWYDNGDDSAYNYDSTTGSNLKFKISYDVQASSVSHEGNIQNVYIWDYTKDDYTHVIDLYFTLGPQMRHAVMSTFANSGPGWNDANSWNFRIEANSNGGSATTDDEFGIYKYTYIEASGDPSVTTTPGTSHTDASNHLSPNTAITFKTNDQFRIKVDINDLTSGSNTLAASNVWVECMNGDTTSYTQFQDGSTPVYLYGSSNSYHSAYANGDSESDTVSWAIDVPLGTAVGTYTSPVQYTIEQP
jgi:hypothetical protein